MKASIPPWAVAIAILVAVVLLGFLGWKQVKPPEALSTAPPPFIDPVTHRPKGSGPGSGMPKQATPGGATEQPAGGQ